MDKRRGREFLQRFCSDKQLLALSSKLIVPALQSLCERFLMTHASGRPIVALALAEQHGNAELYREASRFVLDQATWDAGDLEYLSEQTQLKLSQRWVQLIFAVDSCAQTNTQAHMVPRTPAQAWQHRPEEGVHLRECRSC